MKGFSFLFFLCVFFSCNTLKYVPENELLLDEVKLKVDNSKLPKTSFNKYILQTPNSKFFNVFNVGVFWYNLSKQDTSKWINRVYANLGEPPVLYDSIQTMRSCMSMKKYLDNSGYFDAKITADAQVKDRKVKLKYNIKLNEPYLVRSYKFISIDDSISNYVDSLMNFSIIKKGDLLNSENLDKERTRISSSLRQLGYYDINKNFFAFNIDSSFNSHKADVVLIMNNYEPIDSRVDNDSLVFQHPRYKVKSVNFILDIPVSDFANANFIDVQDSNILNNNLLNFKKYDIYKNGGYSCVYRDSMFLNFSTLYDNCMITPNAYFDESGVKKTYSRFVGFRSLKYVNIRFVKVEKAKDPELDCYILLTPDKKYGISFELEGTNTAGDLGIAGNIKLINKNLFKGSEYFQTKFSGAYEALSSSFESDYTQFGVDLSYVIPSIKFPFVNSRVEKNIDGNTIFKTSYERMSRPEFIRNVLSAGIQYKINKKKKLTQSLDVIDLSYLYMPYVSKDFADTYLLRDSYLKYTYQDQFILRMAYGFTYSNVLASDYKKTHYVLRGSLASAGNFLYGACSLLNISKKDGAYQISNIPFSQYLKGELEFSRNLALGTSLKNRIAYRLGVGVAFPYGNSLVLPFEKRFYAGGANSLRGWSVRTLGPGSYKSENASSDFMNKSGDIKLNANIEYRSSLFWKLEGAIFYDMGNIWTIRNYDSQPEGQIGLDFYKQIAMSTGVGIRLDFSYFLFRLDLGYKVYDPELDGSSKWRFNRFMDSDNYALHFAIGYPF